MPDLRGLTLVDVAEHAGVSLSTASLVVRNAGRISPATRDKVRASIAELGYVYNRGAASLRRRSVDTVGVVITNVANPFFGELLRSLQAELATESMSCLIVNTGQDPAAQAAAVTELREHRVAGIAVVPASGTTTALVDQLTTSQLPHVFMTRYVKDAPTHYVGANDHLGGRLAMTHLLEHGARSVAYLGGPLEVQSRQDRLDGVLAALVDAGQDPTEVVDLPSESTGEAGLATGRRLLEREPLPDALVCHSDQVAFGVYRALREAGVQPLPPVIGYDNIPTAELWEPPLTTVSTHAHQLGTLAARNLIEQFRSDSRDSASLSTVIEPELVIRASCGPH